MHTKGIHQGIGLCLEWGLTAVELGLSNFFRWWQQSWSWRGKHSFFKNTVLYSILSSDKIQVCFMTGCNKFTDCHSFAMSCSQNQTCFCAQPLRFPFSDKQCKSVNIKLSLKKENKQKLIFLPIKLLCLIIKLLWLITHSPQFFQFLLLILFKHSLHHNLQDSIEKLSNGAWLANLSSKHGYATYLAIDM